MVGSFVLLAVLLALSGCLSSSETVLFGLDRHELYRCSHSRNGMRRLAAELMTSPRRVLLTILIGNTTVNVLIFASSFVLSRKLATISPVLASLWGLVTVVLVIVVGEVLAKTLAISMRFALAPVVAPGIQVLQILFTPLRVVFEYLLVAPATRLITGRGDSDADQLEIDELHALVDISRQGGVIGGDERDMLQEVVALASTRVRSIMIPRVDIIAFDLRGTREELLAIMGREKLTKVPVYEKDIDRLRGLIHIKDLHLSQRAPLRDLIRPVRFVPEQITVEKLLSHFRATRTQLAIVVDEYGGVAGLVSMEDVAEQIVGDISEQGEAEPVQTVDERTYRMAGDVSVEAWGQLLTHAVHLPRVTTLGGLVAATLGRLPRDGDDVVLGNMHMTVERMKGHRVEWIRVHLAEDPVS